MAGRALDCVDCLVKADPASKPRRSRHLGRRCRVDVTPLCSTGLRHKEGHSQIFREKYFAPSLSLACACNPARHTAGVFSNNGQSISPLIFSPARQTITGHSSHSDFHSITRTTGNPETNIMTHGVMKPFNGLD